MSCVNMFQKPDCVIEYTNEFTGKNNADSYFEDMIWLNQREGEAEDASVHLLKQYIPDTHSHMSVSTIVLNCLFGGLTMQIPISEGTFMLPWKIMVCSFLFVMLSIFWTYCTGIHDSSIKVVSFHACIHTHTHIHTHAYTHIHTHACTHTHTHTYKPTWKHAFKILYIYTHMCVYTHTRMIIHAYIHICVCVYVQLYIYIYIYIYTNIITYKHACMHTY